MKKDKPRILFVGTLPPPIHGSAVVSQQIKDSKVINDAFEGDWVNLSTSRTMDEIGKKTFAKPFRFLNALLKEFWLLLTHFCAYKFIITDFGQHCKRGSGFFLVSAAAPFRTAAGCAGIFSLFRRISPCNFRQPML